MVPPRSPDGGIRRSPDTDGRDAKSGGRIQSRLNEPRPPGCQIEIGWDERSRGGTEGTIQLGERIPEPLHRMAKPWLAQPWRSNDHTGDSQFHQSALQLAFRIRHPGYRDIKPLEQCLLDCGNCFKVS